MIPRLNDLMIEYRVKRGLSRRDVSEKVLLSEKTIQNYEDKITEISYNSAILIGERLMGMSKYNILISFTPSYIPIIGKDISGEIISDQKMLEEINSNYYISGNRNLFILLKDTDLFFELSVEADISKERLEQIKESYYNENSNLSLEETIAICKTLNKRFSEVFALVGNEFLTDKNSINVAHTLQRYIDKQGTPHNTLRNMESSLTENELVYLKEMLKVYRKLKLKGTLD